MAKHEELLDELENGVPMDAQALMQLRLADSVSEIVQKEIRLALRDEKLLSQIFSTHTMSAVVEKEILHSVPLKTIIKDTLINQLNRK